MFDVFGSLKKLLTSESVNIDNNIFRLHYKLTVIMLLSFSAIVTARQYVGDPIDCMIERYTVPSTMVDTFCWIHSTFTVDKLHEPDTNMSKAYPGVGPHLDGKDAVTHHTYYQWVCFILFFQALGFYCPRYLWKAWEGGRMRKLVGELGDALVPGERTADINGRLVGYFVANMHAHGAYVAQFMLCEWLCFANVVVQLALLHRAFENRFLMFGLDLLRLSRSDPGGRTDNMSRLFPRMAKCSFNVYGASGTVQTYDSLCILPLNIVNEQIFVFLSFWLMVVAPLTGLNLVYHAAVAVSSKLRLLLLRARYGLPPRNRLVAVNDLFGFGDWFVLYHIGKNCEPAVFKELVNNLADRFSGYENVSTILEDVNLNV